MRFFFVFVFSSFFLVFSLFTFPGSPTSLQVVLSEFGKPDLDGGSGIFLWVCVYQVLRVQDGETEGGGIPDRVFPQGVALAAGVVVSVVISSTVGNSPFAPCRCFRGTGVSCSGAFHAPFQLWGKNARKW